MYLHPSELRVANTRRIFRMLLAKGSCSRAELSRVSGLSPVTAGKVVDELITLRLAEEVDPERSAEVRSAGAMGRPPRIVTLMRAAEFPVVELGVHETRLSVAALSPQVSPVTSVFRTPRSEATFIRKLGTARGALGAPKPRLLLVSVPGVLDQRTDEVVFSPNLRWTCVRGFLRRVARGWRTQLCAVQEIQALALGHQATEDAPDSFLLVDFGDGVGGAVITGGQLLQGPRPMCGELGHTEVFGNKRRCGCGSMGCLETLVSRSGLLASFRAVRRHPRATWQQLRDHVNTRGVERWLAPSIDAAAGVIAGAINLLGIEHVVLTGDLAGLHADIAPMLGANVEKHTLIGKFSRLRCTGAPRRRVQGMIAAAADRVLLPEPAMLRSAAREVAV